MSKDKRAQITVRDMHKLTKKELRSVAQWLRTQASTLGKLTEKDQMWLVNRKDYAPIFRMSLMK
jgi:hypothetical protein